MVSAVSVCQKRKQQSHHSKNRAPSSQEVYFFYSDMCLNALIIILSSSFRYLAYPSTDQVPPVEKHCISCHIVMVYLSLVNS
jgi:hypothetical protein